jgi:predicted nucleic acid-binding protein
VSRRLAFDSDVLIYAADPTHPHAERLRKLLLDVPPQTHSGSVLLYVELLARPLRLSMEGEVRTLRGFLGTLNLIEITAATALLATQLAAAYRLRAPDALHLACAVEAGADALLTNNRKDFRQGEILELGVLYPEDL